MILVGSNSLFRPGLSLVDSKIFSAWELDDVDYRLQLARGLLD